MPLIQVILEVANIFLNVCSVPSMPVFHAVYELALVMLELVHEEPIFGKFSILHYTNIQAFCCRFSLSIHNFPIESYFLAVVVVNVALPEGKFFLEPIVCDKLFLIDTQQVVIVVYVKRREDLA